jgi:hypothetical protein
MGGELGTSGGCLQRLQSFDRHFIVVCTVGDSGRGNRISVGARAGLGVRSERQSVGVGEHNTG